MKMTGTTKVWQRCAWTIHIRVLAITCCNTKFKGQGFGGHSGWCNSASCDTRTSVV